MPKGHDVSDWITLGHTREQLDALIERAPAADSVRDTANGENKPPRPNWRYHDDEPAAATSWAIKNILPETGAGLISGQWGSFKTTVALDVSVSLMSCHLPAASRSSGGAPLSASHQKAPAD
jgi:AAA domain